MSGIPTGTIYHYCPAETFLKIIERRELWLSDLSMSNDPSEGSLVAERIKDQLTPLVDKEHEAEARAYSMAYTYRKYEATLGACFSQDRDLLGQWREYADGGKGFVVGFDAARLHSLKEFDPEGYGGLGLFQFVEVNYDRPSQELEVEQLLGRKWVHAVLVDGETGEGTQTGWNWLAVFFQNHNYIWKPEEYSQEREWRLICKCKFKDGRDLVDGVGMRASAHGASLYYPLNFNLDPFDCVTEVVIGPKNLTDRIKLQVWLKHLGYPDMSVINSSVHMR